MSFPMVIVSGDDPRLPLWHLYQLQRPVAHAQLVPREAEGPGVGDVARGGWAVLVLHADDDPSWRCGHGPWKFNGILEIHGSSGHFSWDLVEMGPRNSDFKSFFIGFQVIFHGIEWDFIGVEWELMDHLWVSTITIYGQYWESTMNQDSIWFHGIWPSTGISWAMQRAYF